MTMTVRRDSIRTAMPAIIFKYPPFYIIRADSRHKKFHQIPTRSKDPMDGETSRLIMSIVTIIIIVACGILGYIDFGPVKRGLFSDSSIKVSTPADFSFLKTILFMLFDRKTKNKIKLIASGTGFFYSLNSGFNNTFVYKQIWDSVYELELPETQFNMFFRYFKEGKRARFQDIKNLFRSHSSLWSEDNTNVFIFNQIAPIFFLDNVVTQEEVKYFNILGEWLDIPQSNLNTIFQSYINKYQFTKDELSGNYKSSYRFSNTADEDEDSSREQNNYQSDFNSTYGSDYSFNYNNYTSNENYSSNSQYKNQSYTHSAMSEKLRSACLLLQIDENAPEAEAKRAYHKLMHRYHPDRAYGKNLPPDEVQHYKELCQEIQNAWEIICQERHW